MSLSAIRFRKATSSISLSVGVNKSRIISSATEGGAHRAWSWARHDIKFQALQRQLTNWSVISTFYSSAVDLRLCRRCDALAVASYRYMHGIWLLPSAPINQLGRLGDSTLLLLMASWAWSRGRLVMCTHTDSMLSEPVWFIDNAWGP